MSARAKSPPSARLSPGSRPPRTSRADQSSWEGFPARAVYSPTRETYGTPLQALGCTSALQSFNQGHKDWEAARAKQSRLLGNMMSTSTLGMTLSTDERARILQQAWGTSNSPQRPSKLNSEMEEVDESTESARRRKERDLSPGTTLARQAQQVQNNILDRNRSSQEKRRAAHEYSQQSSPPPPSPEDDTNAYFSHTDRPAQRIRSSVERIEAKMIRREHSRKQMEEKQQRGNRATEHGFIARSADSNMERMVLKDSAETSSPQPQTASGVSSFEFTSGRASLAGYLPPSLERMQESVRRMRAQRINLVHELKGTNFWNAETSKLLLPDSWSLTERNVGVADMGNQDGGAASALASWHCRELAASLLRSESSARQTTPVLQGTIDQDWITEQMEQMVHIRGQVEAARAQNGVQSKTIREQNIALGILREENESLKSKLLKPSNSDTVVDKLAGPSNSDDARIKEELEAQLLDFSEQLEFANRRILELEELIDRARGQNEVSKISVEDQRRRSASKIQKLKIQFMLQGRELAGAQNRIKVLESLLVEQTKNTNHTDTKGSRPLPPRIKGPKASAKQQQKADAMLRRCKTAAENHAVEGVGTAEDYADLADQTKLQTVAQDQLTVWLGEEQSIIQDAQRRKQPVSAETDRTFNLLRPMQLFASISDHALRGLANVCWEFSVVQGQDVVQQGSPGTDSLFVVASGTLVAYKIDAACLCNYERGQYFGERVMLAKNDRQARGASVRATTADTTVVQIWRKDLVKLPIVINRLRELLKISKSSGSSLDRKIVKRYLNSGMQSEHVDLDSQTRMMFEEMDEDDSGMLDRAEVKMLCKMLGMPLTDDDVDKAMMTMDEDGGGEVDYDEFETWWRAQGGN